MTSTRRFCLPLRTLFAIAALLCAALLSHPGAAVSAPAIPPQSSLGVCSAILYDLDRDAILFEQNADQRIPPASLTKIMSMFLAMDQINSGLARIDNTTTISRNAARTGGSRMGLNENEQVTLDQLLTGMAVSSGNDASTAMAEYVGGSVPAFINMMNAKARDLGMRDSYFVNPHGLPAKGQYTTARDMLTLARAYLHAYPDALRFHNTHVLNYRGRVTWNKNPLLGQYPGADGLKTGWINASGYNLVFTALKGDKRLLAVIMGAPDSQIRSIEAFRLLDAGFEVCNNEAPTVLAALDTLPREKYHPDIRKNAREAYHQFAGNDRGEGAQTVHRAKATNHSKQAKATRTAKNKKKNVEKVARHRSNDNDGQAARRVANNAS
ncbi:hypothetical protein SDC9_06841 [bioreactor metagenome]|uniref:Serine-type D-Ala-D-Ala carboxypeptidase n=4 Tax=root TaxID=1 RepID=A0A212K048_9BACT|nr:D-alanyl-D-alanine carboxypeptidase family protein [Desulfovibrio desulfuricans]MBD8895940.1 D-alanyl-D-alanine carboxypeptidase [Desulfovibrio desulfuricans]MCB6541184.1 D-alanyl-D-alanine carboxypeptidase [Desulfovibrio desulfuricans]MCB6552266.1 D-alanyl-D-alanine carboxypeptidase [Desulfovibrio desulfuricans]MCB6564109.1 D-alanyl-D-alanine carboxypeptidase [Desulfovibrio desulfuricans]MCB7345289.1 D-alanyl-D-alanine carboxypeptidase [Desulfovibrio desulfuricans]